MSFIIRFTPNLYYGMSDINYVVHLKEEFLVDSEEVHKNIR